MAGDEIAAPPRPRRTLKAPTAYRTISEVSQDLDVPQHVLRFWESKFPQISPLKRGGGRRYYRPDDIALLTRIRAWLYGEGYTIKGVQRLLQEGGARVVDGGAADPAPTPGDAQPLPLFGAPRGEPPALLSPALLLSDSDAAPADGAEHRSPDRVMERRQRLRAILDDLYALRRLVADL